MNPDSKLGTDLADRTRFQRLWHLFECASTQDLAATLPACAIVWADHQTRGRGRQQHSWYDEPGLDLLLTFQVTDLSLPNPLALAAVTPLAVAQALEPHLGRELRIKWPNDVFLDGRKLAGVLIDAPGERPDCYLIGIGVNINRTRFPKELGESATSLALATGHAFDRHQLVLELAVALDRCLTAISAGAVGELANGFARRLALLGRKVTVLARGLQHHGQLVAVDFERLRLDGERQFSLGEVQAIAPG